VVSTVMAAFGVSVTVPGADAAPGMDIRVGP